MVLYGQSHGRLERPTDLERICHRCAASYAEPHLLLTQMYVVEARQVIDTVKTSKIPTAAYGDELGRSLPGSKTEGLRPTNTDVDGSQSNSTSQRGSFTDDYSPGRAQYQTGIANLHQTREVSPISVFPVYADG